jgi:methyl acetate hydrolase
MMGMLRVRLDNLLRAGVDRGDVPGVVAMVVSGEGTLYEGAFGERALGGGVSMTMDTVFAIASMTKAITATAVMQLVEQGRLSIDGPASDIVPYLGDVEVLQGFDEGGQPITRPPIRPITLRHLLTHTAGFGYEIFNREILDFQAATGSPSIFTRSLEALKTPLLFDPGGRWNYGISIDWAGQMVEAVSGQSLGDYMQDNIFEPLGMASSGFAANGGMTMRQATTHLRGEDGELFIPENAPPQPEPEFDSGGFALLSTIQDYARFTRMILNRGSLDGQDVLRPETVNMTSVNQMGDNRVSPLLTEVPAFSNDADFFPGVEKTWGLSFMINLGPGTTGRSPGGLAWAGMTNMYFWIDPAKDMAGIYGTQIFPFADKLSLPLYLDFETAVYETL